MAPGWGTRTGPRWIWASSVAPCGSGLDDGIGMSSSTAAGEVDGGFPNVRLQLLDGGRSWQRNPEPDPGRWRPLRRSSSTTIGRRRGSRATMPPSASFIRCPLRRSSGTTRRRHGSWVTAPLSASGIQRSSMGARCRLRWLVYVVRNPRRMRSETVGPGAGYK
jgi:hypothetical protein